MAERRTLFEESGFDPEDSCRAEDRRADINFFLQRMATVMRHRSGDQAWAARAYGSEKFAYGRTAMEAMTAALEIDKPAPRARKSIEL